MAVRSVGTIGTGTSAIPSCGVPASVAANDITFLFASIDELTASFTGKWPTGFTQLLDSNGLTFDGQRIGIAWKRTTGADSGTYTLTSHPGVGTQTWVMRAIALSGRHTTNPPVLGTVTLNNTGNAKPVTATHPAVTAVLGDDILSVCFSDLLASTTGQAWTKPTAHTAQISSPDSAGWSIIGVGSLANVAAGSTGAPTSSFTWTTGGTGGSGWAAALIRVPASSTAAALAMAMTDVASLSAALTTGIKLAGDMVAQSTLAGTLSTGIKLSADLTCQAALTSALSTQIKLTAGLLSQATLAADLTSQIRLAATMQAQSVMTGSLAVPINMDVAMQASSSMSAALATAIKLTSAMSDVAALTASLTTQVKLALTLTAQATVGAQLSTAVKLTAGLTCQSTLTASLSGGANLQASLAAQSTLGAALSTQVKLTSALASQSSMTADLTTGVRLDALLSGSSQMTADLTTSILLSSGMFCGSTLSAELSLGVAQQRPRQNPFDRTFPLADDGLRQVAVPATNQVLLSFEVLQPADHSPEPNPQTGQTRTFTIHAP